jgi:hypothetical protein
MFRYAARMDLRLRQINVSTLSETGGKKGRPRRSLLVESRSRRAPRPDWCWCRARTYHSPASTRSHSSSIAWVICWAETASREDENWRSAAPFSPAGAEAAKEATNRSTCRCMSGGNFSTRFAISRSTSIGRVLLLSRIHSEFGGGLRRGCAFIGSQERQRNQGENGAGLHRTADAPVSRL